MDAALHTTADPNERSSFGHAQPPPTRTIEVRRSKTGTMRADAASSARVVERPAAPSDTGLVRRRFALEYYDPRDALDDAHRVASQRFLVIEDVFGLDTGTEVLFDLRSVEVPWGPALRFRVVGRHGDRCLLEWIAESFIDAWRLTFWTSTLEVAIRPDGSGFDALGPHEFLDLLNLCRRMLDDNPFTALGVDWTWTQAEVDDHCARLVDTLDLVRRRVGQGTRAHQCLGFALARYGSLHPLVATPSARQRSRALYLSIREVRDAVIRAHRELGEARRRHDRTQFERATAAIHELRGPHAAAADR